MMGRHCTMGVLLFAVCAHTPSAALRAQERSQPEGNITIVQTEWGFDGKAMSRSFVPLSVLVQNDGPNPASGTLRLTKSLGLRHQVDAAFEQSFYVSGFSSKWVQLTPFVVGEFESWEITWGPGNRNRYDIPTPRVGTGATVLFADADDISAVGSALRRCDPALFPVSVTGTDSLRGAVLHSVPEWQGARVQAFREWLERGGRVFLVHGANGEYPRFSGELAFLNDARESVRVGTGRVTRLPLSVRDLDADLVKSLLAVDRTETNEADVARRMLEYSRGAALPIRTDFDDYILKDLRRLTRFQRNWWLVYACAGLYVLAVFPGSYLLGRRVADWRWFYVGFLGIAVLFSAGFTKLGELGSADRSRARSVATAYQLAEGLYDVTQLTCVASRSGDLYELSTAGSGRLYSSLQEVEPVNGTVRLQDGRLDVDLPPASTCNVALRARKQGPALGVQLARLQTTEFKVEELEVRFAPGVYDRSMIVCAWHGRSVYEMEADAGGARLGKHRTRGVQFVDTFGGVPFQQRVQRNQWMQFGVPADDEPESTAERFQTLLYQAVGMTLNLRAGTDPNDVALDPSILRLLIYRPMPDDFRFEGDQLPDQQGYVLYVVDLPIDGGVR